MKFVSLSPIETYQEFHERQESELELFVWTALRRNGWSVRATATELKIKYKQLYAMVKTPKRFPSLHAAWSGRRVASGRPRGS